MEERREKIFLLTPFRGSLFHTRADLSCFGKGAGEEIEKERSYIVSQSRGVKYDWGEARIRRIVRSLENRI